MKRAVSVVARYRGGIGYGMTAGTISGVMSAMKKIMLEKPTVNLKLYGKM